MSYFKRRYVAYRGHRSGYHAFFARTRWLWWSLVVAYFVLGFLLLGTKWYVTTHADELRDRLTAAVSQATGAHIEADRFELDLHGFWPRLNIEGLRFSHADGTHSLTIPIIRAELSWASFWTMEPRFRNLMVYRPELAVRRLDKERLDVAGFVVPLPAQDETDDEHLTIPASIPALSLLFAQKNLALVDGVVTYRDMRTPDNPPARLEKLNFRFQDELLDWRSGLDGLFVNGRRQDAFSMRLHLEKGLFNDVTMPRTWKARAYVSLDRTNVGQFARRLGLQKFLSSGEGRLRLWADLDKGRLSHLEGDLGARNVRLQLAEHLTPLALRVASGYFTYEHDAENTHSLTVDRLKLVSDDLWELGPSRVTVRHTADAAGRTVGVDFGASEIDIALLSAIGTSLPLPKDVLAALHEYPVSGRILDLSASGRDDLTKLDNWRTFFRFEGLTLAADAKHPGFRNLSGSVQTEQTVNSLTLTLDAQNASLTFPGVFRRDTMHFTKLAAEAVVSKENVWSVRLNRLQAENSEAAVTGSGTWRLDDDVAGTVSLSGSILRADGPSVRHYLPNVVGDGTLDWLEAGILRGNVTSGDWVLQGRLAQFPWSKKSENGLFRIRGHVSGGTLDFLPAHERDPKTHAWKIGTEWPTLTKVEADLLFEGERMLITGQSAHSMGLHASDVRVEIPAFSADPVVLKVDGRIQGDAKNGLHYLNEAPMLSRILGGAFEQSTGSGPIDVRLGLVIPLNTPDKLSVNVAAGLRKTRFSYGYGIPVLEDAEGTLHITEKSVFTKEPIRGKTTAGPARVSARTTGNNVILDIDGRITPVDLAGILPSPSLAPFWKALSGSAPARVYANIGLKEGGVRISGRSDLSGLASSLPAPFAKASAETWPTSFSWSPRPSGFGFTLSSPGHAETALYFDRHGNDLALTSGFIGIGVPMARVSDRIDIAVASPKLLWNEWEPYWQQIDAAQKGHSDGTVIPWGTLRLQVGELHVHRTPFHNIDATLRHFGTDDWHLRLASDEVNGQIEVLQPPAQPAQWNVKIDRAHLPEAADEEIDTALDVQPTAHSLPNVQLTIDDLRLGERRIGKVEFAVRNEFAPDGEGLAIIDRIAVTSRGGTLQGQGVWRPDSAADAVGTSHVTLDAHFSDLGRLLHDLHIRDVIRNAPGNVKLDLTWRGQPHQPQIETLAGEVTAVFGSGQILQVEPGSGRLLSLLSMQHLLQRLTLDFRDVIGRGFTFDSISAGGKLANGVLSTEKVAIVGSPATILISGQTDLVRETLDLQALVLPKFNADAPALALTLLNPAVGVGTFVAQWFLKDEISNLMSSTYKISGTFQNPVIDKATTGHPTK